MKAYRPSNHRDAEVSQKVQASRASQARVRTASGRIFDRKSCTKAKLSDEQIRWVRANWNQAPEGTLTIAEMARQLNVGPATVGQICRGNTWKEIK